MAGQDDPRGAQAHLDFADPAPAMLPTWIVRDRRVEPCSWSCSGPTLGLEHTFVSLVIGRFGKRAGGLAIDAVTGSKGLYTRRARPEGARNPLVALTLVHPTFDVVNKPPERDPLVYAHAYHPRSFSLGYYKYTSAHTPDVQSVRSKLGLWIPLSALESSSYASCP